MHEIKCPHCQKAFKIDEAGYADIAKQVRDTEFERLMRERLEFAEQEKRTAVELAEALTGQPVEPGGIVLGPLGRLAHLEPIGDEVADLACDVDDGAGHRSPRAVDLDLRRHRHAEPGEAVEVVRGAVEWINDPNQLVSGVGGRFCSLLFAEKRVVGVACSDEFLDGFLAFFIFTIFITRFVQVETLQEILENRKPIISFFNLSRRLICAINAANAVTMMTPARRKIMKTTPKAGPRSKSMSCDILTSNR